MFEHDGNTFYVSDGISFSNLRFENDVEMYGAQAGNIVDRYSVPKFRKDTVCLRKQ